MTDTATQLARLLLEAGCVKLQPEQPFTWASGWISPFYCDNRKTLAYPPVRTFVKNSLAQLIRSHYPHAQAIAGVATGAIAQAALVADALQLPMCYVRPQAKDHGMGKQIEGTLPPGAQVVVVEDLISTGGSSLKAVAALRSEGFDVLGMVASFTYGFDTAQQAFRDAALELHTLTCYDALVHTALAQGHIRPEHLPLLAAWRQQPEQWGKQPATPL